MATRIPLEQMTLKQLRGRSSKLRSRLKIAGFRRVQPTLKTIQKERRYKEELKRLEVILQRLKNHVFNPAAPRDVTQTTPS